MATSVYKPYILLTSMNYSGFFMRPGDDFSPLVGTKIPEEVNYMAYSGGSLSSSFLRKAEELFEKRLPSYNTQEDFFPGILVSACGSHQCRETVISSIHNLMSENNKKLLVGKPIVIIHYVSESGPGGLSFRAEKMMEFASRVFPGPYPAFSVTNNDDKLIISFDYTEVRKLYDWSLLSWCIRILAPITGYLDYLDSTKSTKSTWNDFLIWLSHKFIENPAWGNSYNNIFSLSLYSYMAGKGKMDFSMANPINISGPHNLAQRVQSVSGLKGWIEEVILPKKYPKEPELNLSGLSQDFRESVEQLYGLVWGKYHREQEKAMRSKEVLEEEAKAAQELMDRPAGARTISSSPRKSRKISPKTMDKVLGVVKEDV